MVASVRGEKTGVREEGLEELYIVIGEWRWGMVGLELDEGWLS